MEEPSVTNPGKNVEEESENFKNPMHLAVIKGDVKAIVALKKSRVKIYQKENGQTPLHLAIIKGKTLVVRKLISWGANLSKMNKDGYAPLHLAVLHNRASIIEDLINMDTESDVDIFDRNGNTALHIAVSMGNACAVRALLIEGANADLRNKEGNAPLHLAVIQGNPKVIDVVLKYVRKPNILDKNKFRPLHLAVLLNQIGAIRKIGRVKDAKINNLNGDGDAALHLATKLRNLEAIEALLDLKANVNLKNSKGFSPVHLAVIYRKLSATKILARIDEAKRFKNTPIHVAEAQKNIPVLRLLCLSKANVNIKNVYGDSILHSVIMTDCEDAVIMLLDLGAKLDVYNLSSGVTPLHVAVCFGNKDIIEMLLGYGADMHSRDGCGDLPIHSSAKFCSSVGIETLIKHGENLSLRNTSGLTPLDIIMLYIREDTFGTSVQTLTDLYKKRYLKRRSPLSSHEILKSAKLIFKFEIWKNLEHSKLNDPEYQSNIIPILRSYINDCFAEIRQMKSTILHESFYFYEFAIKGWVNTMSLTQACASEVVLNHILDVSTTKGYPIYRDIIVSNLERPSLLKKVRCWSIPVIHNGKTTLLDLDAVPKYLGNDDILNLLLAYSDPDPSVSESSSVKKRKLAES